MPKHLQVPLTLVAGIQPFPMLNSRFLNSLAELAAGLSTQRHLYPNPDPDSLALICLLGPSADPGLGSDSASRSLAEQPGLQC